MHFKTLVTVYMPTVEEDPHENAAVRQSIELLQARKDDLAKDIMAELTLCSLMGRTTNFARQLVGAVEEVMTPYSTEPPEEYKEFADMTEELKADYAKSVDCLKLPNGKIVECGSYPYFSKYSIVDGKVSQNKVGPLHHTRRTKQSRKRQYLPNYPRQKVYKTFEKYAEDYRGYEYNKEEKRYGFYCNPNAMWDWYQIGGRWPVTFLVKADCTEYSFGERSWGNTAKNTLLPKDICGFRQQEKKTSAGMLCGAGILLRIRSDTPNSRKRSNVANYPMSSMVSFERTDFFAAASAPMQPVKPWTNTLPA